MVIVIGGNIEYVINIEIKLSYLLRSSQLVHKEEKHTKVEVKLDML